MRTHLDIKMDTNTFILTSQVVMAINDSAKDRYNDSAELRDFMEDMAYLYCCKEKGTFFSTGGFCLSTFDTDTERHIVATVMAYTASKMVEPKD